MAYNREIELQQQKTGAVSWRDASGVEHEVVAAGVSRKLNMTVWRRTLPTDLNVGDTRTWNGETWRITASTIAEEAVEVSKHGILRLWKCALQMEPSTAPDSTTQRMDSALSKSYSMPGRLEETVTGDLVHLKATNAPVKWSLRETRYQANDTPPVTAGTAYGGGICTSCEVSRVVVERDGVAPSVLWQVQIEAEGTV